MSSEVKCWCRHCKRELPPSHTGPCPYCGKKGKDCKVTAKATVGISASLRARKKRKGVGRFVKEIIQGVFASSDPKLKKGVDKVRIVDREKNEYHEVVKNAETGETIREVHEPLSQHTHSNQNWTWCSFFFDRVGRLIRRFWKVLAAYSVLILILSAILYILVLFYSKGEALSVETSSAIGTLTLIFAAMLLGLAVAIFLFAFILLFILSFSPGGRRLADKIFGFSKLTKLEKFKNKVDSELAVINERLGNIEKRLYNFESTTQKPKEQEVKIMGSKGRRNVKKPKKSKVEKQAAKKK
jgi:hypothetical protein